MKKPVIAIDIDDVLSQSATGFAEYSNSRWQSGITADDYSEEWAKVWRVPLEEAVERAIELHESGIIGNYRHHQDAASVLSALAGRFELVIVTSRRLIVQPETDVWLERHFGNIFSSVHYAGIWDKAGDTLHKVTLTKAEICKQVGAKYLIDDQLKHCEGAANAGLQAILFGDYAWNKAEQLPTGIVRAHTWSEVMEYFNER